MSVAVMAAVWELDLPRDQKLVLMGFADHANDDGYCWPSTARIAWKCGYAQKRSVSVVVQKLIELGVLAIVDQPHGRRPATYQVRPHRGPRLPTFDPQSYRGGGPSRGAVNAPHENGVGDKSLNESAISGAENLRGAVNAPQIGTGAVNAPKDSVGVRSAHSRGAVDDTVGVRSTTHRTIRNHQEPLAHGAPAERPGPGARKASGDSEEFLLNNTARQLGISERTRSESLEAFRDRVERAHGARLRAQVERREERRRTESST